MLRTLLWCAALAALPLPAWAGQTMTSTETIVRLTVQPMTAPKPALRYLLLPDLKEMSPGNPIPNYLRCFMELQDPNQDTFGGSALRQADRAARMDKPDWQILLKLRTDGVSLLLPDLQQLRTLAQALKERFHREIALRRFDDALITAKTMFAMSRHLGEHPTLIGQLVGIAVANVATGPLEELLEQPGCPNLYWALTNLPSPLIPLDKGIEGERMLILGELHDLDDAIPMTAEQLRKLIARIEKLRAFDQVPFKKSTRAWLDARTNAESVRAARGRLVEAGLAEERLLRFPADQVMLLDEKRDYEERRDEAMKLMIMPFWQMEAMVAQAEGLHGIGASAVALLASLEGQGPVLVAFALAPGKDQLKSVREPALFEFLATNFVKIRYAQGRLEQRIALLRHVEALRLYAAAHDGRLPKQLADVPVPLPVNPYSGQPFHYRVDGNTAHLHGEPPPGAEKNPAMNVRFEVTIQK